MPDIAMCVTHECDKKDTCYRYQANPSYTQIYALFEADACERYIEIETKKED